MTDKTHFMNNEKRVINIPKELHEAINNYCKDTAHNVNKWIANTLLEALEEADRQRRKKFEREHNCRFVGHLDLGSIEKQ